MQNRKKDLWCGKVKLRSKLRDESGTSMAAALLFFMVCSIGASMMLSKAMIFMRKTESLHRAYTAQFSLESAAQFLRDEITAERNTVKIIEEQTADRGYVEVSYYYIGEGEDPKTRSLWQEFKTEKDEGVLGSMVREVYAVQCGETDEYRLEERKLSFTAEAEDIKTTAKIRIWMEFDYTIRADISDEAEKNLLRLTFPADVQTENENDGLEDVKITTIKWEKGTIEK